MLRKTLTALPLVLALVAAAPSAQAQKWVGSWASAQQIPEPHNALPNEDLQDVTLRQIIHLSLGGPRLRVRVSNAFGTAPLTIGAASVALSSGPGSPGLRTQGAPLTFSGKRQVIIPAGAEYLSDPVALAAPAGADLAVSLYLGQAPERQTSHPGSRTTSYLLKGEHVADADLPGAKAVDHWYQLSGVEIDAPRSAAALVTLGDSITDGRGSTTNGNDRWPDLLAARLRADARTRGVAVVNLGTGGNRLLNDGLGPSALARFDRDVLGQAGVRWVFVLEGINDIGTLKAGESAQAHAELVQRMIGAYEQIIERAHAHGLKVVGATLLPFQGSDYDKADPLREQDRQAVNRWIRTSGRFDAVVDFDQVTRDPTQPLRLRPEFDTGDHLHPSPAGYKAMAEAIPLSLFGAAR
ncbi:SGNH/GDSL hydrolase family protein [Phenylobacterium deserti]|uniref:SGNH/GDSL hydrolase family protein n=1 Tax=Phenylobacterium deserti TaxID=1914756 RepID=A0A328AD58_9CAUL|nr:SGNH/GDSL hydrolase family protein [Phenylobacterium deserti]RAK51334.1 SGNH/GDSL hydrolase family protein [Phenylobacterium deserti]